MKPRQPIEFDELDAQNPQLLPVRETLFAINVSPVVGVNISLALNAASIGTTANSFAGQQLFALQH